MKHNATTRAILALFFSATLLFTLLNVPARAFFEWQAEDGSLDLRGLIRGFGSACENPERGFFYQDRSDTGAGAVARLIMEAQAGQHFGLELNAYQTWILSSLASRQTGLGTSFDVERSAGLEWSFSDDEYVHLAIDRANIRWSRDRLDLIIGRQPVNLATTFYFTPNDFFAPFAAQAFYRVYKPGVDAVRAGVRLGNLSQMSLIGVLGYKRDLVSETGWSNEPDTNRSSYVGRISTVLFDFDLALFGGVIREANVIGGALQGELFQWLGVRAEGHSYDPDDSKRGTYPELSAGIEHRWENSLTLRLEQFYHGGGASDRLGYGAVSTAAPGENAYLGRNYTALGASYEFTPLLNAEMLAIANLTDYSYLLSINAVYSLSDEAEVAINLGAPIGRKPKASEIRSEFGLYPYSVNIEVRYYF